MKMLLSTTALVVALGFPTLTLAQTTSDANTTTQQHNAGQSGFLAERGQSDLFASDLMGHDVYTHRTRDDMDANRDRMNASGDRAAASGDRDNAQGMRNRAQMNRSDLDNMENIGQISDIVLSSDGRVLALVIGVGGFLGMGERDVAVSMDQVTFAADPDSDDRSEMYIVANIGADMLRDSPSFDRMSMGRDARSDNAERRTDTSADQADRSDGRTPFGRPNVARDGYDRADVTEISTEMLMGKAVYDVNDQDVGTVTDMVVDGDGGITHVIIDFGGFLGIGKSQASLAYDELTILTTDGYADVRLYVDATKEQIQDLPQYRASR